ncbi:MAG: hypothetical protein ABIO81_07105, partial [Ginsengibacter sp.]
MLSFFSWATIKIEERIEKIKRNAFIFFMLFVLGDSKLKIYGNDEIHLTSLCFCKRNLEL